MEHLDAIHRARAGQLAARARVLRQEMAEQLPDWHLGPIRGGLVGWAQLPFGSASHVALLAARHGLAVAGGRAFSTSAEFDDHIRLPFTAPEAALREAVTRLARAWSELPRSATTDDPGVAAIV